MEDSEARMTMTLSSIECTDREVSDRAEGTINYGIDDNSENENDE